MGDPGERGKSGEKGKPVKTPLLPHLNSRIKLNKCISFSMYYNTLNTCLPLPIQGIQGPKGKAGGMGIMVPLTCVSNH